MGIRSAQLLGANLFGRDRLHHVRAGDEHIRRSAHHEDKVGNGRRIHGAARAGPHHQRQLRDNAGSQHVALKDVGIAAQGGHPLLNTGAAGIIQADDRRADLDGLIHHLAYLAGIGFRQGPSEHGEILAEDEHQAAIDPTVAGNHAIPGNALLFHTEIAAAMLDKGVPFLKTPGVQQHVQTLARGELAAFVLPFHPGLAAARA